MTDELLPCPFCGGNAALLDTVDDWRVECNCGSYVVNSHRDRAIAAWNRRVPATGAPVDAIRWLVDRFGEDDPLLPFSPAGRALVQSIRDWLAQRAK